MICEFDQPKKSYSTLVFFGLIVVCSISERGSLILKQRAVPSIRFDLSNGLWYNSQLFQLARNPAKHLANRGGANDATDDSCLIGTSL